MCRIFLSTFQRIVFCTCLILCTNIHAVQSQAFSDKTQISLLTEAPGNELYAAFGHSAIRLRDTTGLDIVFNYGIFDFDAPNFYLNFARGRMNYKLDVHRYDHFIASYVAENRLVREQVFELDSAQHRFIIDFLINNYKPENRYYLYHFFLDNCATRIRDLILQAYDGLVLPESQGHPTYRDLVHDCLHEHPWGRFGIDIALGLPTDAKTGTYEQMFLPYYMFDAFSQATWHDQPIIKETHDLFVPDRPAITPAGAFTPMVMCCCILALSLLFCFVQKGTRVFDFLLFFAVGLVGLMVFTLWFFTDHTNTHGNLNIIWALPTHVVMAFFLLSAKRKSFTQKYFMVTAYIAALLLLAWFFLHQQLNPALIPLVISIALRAFWNWKQSN